MNISNILWNAAKPGHKKAMPILSFPAAQKLGVSVENLVMDAELQARVMKIIAQETTTVAAVSLMDLSVEAEAFGAQVRFTQNELPAIVGQLVGDKDAANALTVPGLTSGRALVYVEAVKLAKQRIQEKPVIAGMIGPYSLAGRLIDVTEIMYLCFDEPEMVHTVLNKATQYLIRYGQAMKDVGADGLMIAEPLAGILSPDMADEFSIPYVKRIITALQDESFAVLYHNCGNNVPQMLNGIYDLGATAYHFGNAINLEEVLKVTPSNILVMGNIDPASKFVSGTTEEMKEAVYDLMEKCGSYSNFVPSSGCDIPAHANWNNINVFFEAVEN